MVVCRSREGWTQLQGLLQGLLEFIENLIIADKIDLSRDQCYLFTKTIERRASLSLFNPNIKKTNRLLCMALDTAILIDDIPSQASLQLLIGQNYWMSFQFERAVHHFDLGWKMINTSKIDCTEIKRRGLQLQGATHIQAGCSYRAAAMAVPLNSMCIKIGRKSDPLFS